MAAAPPTLITDLPKGHQLDAGEVAITPEGVESYLAAVTDSNAVYGETGLAPPLAVAALALARLLEVIRLPGGTLHTGQEIEMNGGVPIGAKLSMSGRIAQRSERAGMTIIVIEFSLSNNANKLLTGRTTLMVTGAAA
jgi:hypothetical protein